MASRFEEDFLLGYTKYTKHFDDWAKKAECILGKISQCGYFGLDHKGFAHIASNSPHIGEEWLDTKGYIIESNWSFIKDFEGSEFVLGGHYLDQEKKIYRPDFLFFWFTFRIVINGMQRVYFFASKDPLLHTALLNNAALVKKFLRAFIKESEFTSSFYQEHKVFMHGEKNDYFLDKEFQMKNERQRANALLQQIGILDKNTCISPREWECLQYYSDGKSAYQTGRILNISRRTVETHFSSIKDKLKIHTKSEIRDLIG